MLNIMGFLVATIVYTFMLVCGYYGTVKRSNWELLDCISFSMICAIWICIEIAFYKELL